MLTQETPKLVFTEENFKFLKEQNDKMFNEIDSYMDMFLQQKQKAEDYARVLEMYSGNTIEDDSYEVTIAGKKQIVETGKMAKEVLNHYKPVEVQQ